MAPGPRAWGSFGGRRESKGARAGGFKSGMLATDQPLKLN